MLENKTGDKFLMLKIKEIKNSLHAIENIKNLSKKNTGHWPKSYRIKRKFF